jgi:hypothetical protein
MILTDLDPEDTHDVEDTMNDLSGRTNEEPPISAQLGLTTSEEQRAASG